MECPRCKGSGLCVTCRGGGQVPCAACGGAGHKTRANGQTLTCTRCGGSGQEACDTACESCLGSGRITDALQKAQTEKYSPAAEAVQSDSVRATVAIIGLLLLNDAIMGLCFGTTALFTPSNTALRSMGAMVPLLFKSGEVWRAVTWGFVHIGIVHIAFNVLALLQAGQVLERQIGAARFVSVFLLSTVGAGLADAALYADPMTHCAGASGAVFGLIGFGLVRAHLHRDAQQRAYFTQWVIYGIVFSMFTRVDNIGHGGGFVTGATLGAAVALLERRGIRGDLAWRLIAAACVAAAVAAYGCMAWGLVERARYAARRSAVVAPVVTVAARHREYAPACPVGKHLAQKFTSQARSPRRVRAMLSA